MYKSSILSKGIRLCISITLAYFLYTAFFKVYDPNFLATYKTETTYPFYSGNKDGAYFSLGDALESKFKDKYHNSPTNGSIENSIKLSQEPHAFGMFGENLYNQLDTRVDIITDIYEEKLHILFRKSSKTSAYKGALTLKSDHNDEIIAKLFKEYKINKGQPNSQVADIVDHILEKVLPDYNKIKDDTSKFFLLPLDKSIEKIKSGDINVLFFMSGYTNKFKELLQDTTKYGLISIDRALFDELKSKYVTTFRYSNFDDSPYGEAYKKIMTVSLKAFLVASKNTPFRDKLNLLENLDKIKGDIPALHNKQFLSQFKEKNVKYESWWIIAIIVIFFFSFIIFHILLWIFSEVLRTIYFNKINDSAIHKIPKNDDYQETNDKKDIEDYSDKFYVYPVIIENQIAIVNRVVRALAFISKVRTEISNSFDRGWLKSSHYKFLIEKSDDITEKLRKTLAIRIHEIIERDERPLKTAQISREYLRKYLTADYLYQKDYEWLISKVDIKEVSTISKKLLIEMLSRALYKEAINLLINFFKTKDEKFVTERDKELYPEIILISAEFHTYTMEKNEFPEEYKRKIKITNHKLFDFIGRLENEKLLD